VILNFKDAANNTVAPGPAPYFRGSSNGWQKVAERFLVPEEAQTMDLMPTLFQAASGTIDFDDFRLTPVDPATVAKPIEMNSPVVAAPAAYKLPPELHVAGNQLRTSDGKAIWLQGLCVDSMQWNVVGERIVQTTEVAISQWKANVIRLPVMDDFWFGEGGHGQEQLDHGARYGEVIDSAINTAAARGVYVVIDLHRFRAPESKQASFWKEVALKYKNHPAVLFELFNEAHDITWEVWRNGGDVTEKVEPKQGVAAENTEALRRFKAVGMQQLVDVIRQTGAKNIIVAGGLDWGYDLTGVLDGYALDDKGGNGIVYSSHVYPWKSGWEKKFLTAAAKYPLFIGEVGCPQKWEDFAFIPVSQRKEKLGPGCTWPNDMIAVIQKYRLNWTGFSFHPSCGPMVIQDWNYTPTSYWGVFVKDALAGKQFELKQMR
jgi:hypothetical protein